MRQLIAYAVSAAVAATAVYAFSHRTPPPLPATELRTDRLLINDMTVDGRRVVAVGEQGIVLTSDDLGQSWQQAGVEPRRGSSLTGVARLSAERLVAVGHDGWILRSEDYSLLMGALLLFGVLAILMIATRRIDWSNVARLQRAQDAVE